MREAEGKRIFVTGGAGFIGKEIVNRLSEEPKANVVVFDINHPIGNFSQNVDSIKGDLRQSKDIARALKKVNPNVVVHLASNVGARGYLETFERIIFQDNIQMDEVLYGALEDAHPELVIHTSSSMVFQNATKYPYEECDLSTTPPPTNVYGLAKLMGERICMKSGKQYIITRYHNVYGPGENAKGQGSANIHVVPAVIQKTKARNLPIEILGNPEDTRPFTYIDDAVEATLILLKQGLAGDTKVVDRDFNIGPAEATKILDLYRLAWDLFGDQRPFNYYLKSVRGTTAHRREMNPRKINEATGWKPKVSLKEGLVKSAR